MKIMCEGCGGFHDISPTGMAVIITALQEGDLQRVTGNGVTPLCLGAIFTPETMQKWRRRIDSKTVITFDSNRWTAERTEKAA